MNLIHDPWIPVLRRDGSRAVVGLRELFADAHSLRDIAVKPLERVAVTRLLLCIAQTALDGPTDEADWEACEPRIPDAAVNYLISRAHCFELFGDGPRFLQLSNLTPGKETGEGNPATKLDLALSSGNNTTLFDNEAGAERAIPPARAAMNLLTYQCFAPTGRIGIANWHGEPTAGDGSSKHAPCAPSSMVHALVLGRTLLETIHRNLLTKEIVVDSYGVEGWGTSIWDRPISNRQDASALANASMTYLGRLVPISRSIRLHDDGVQIILANGIGYPLFPAFREATSTIIRRKEELALLPASTSRSLWRQLGAVAVTRKAHADAASGPLALRHEHPVSSTSLWVGAFVTDKAKIDDIVEATYSVPSCMFEDFGRLAYEAGVEHAEQGENALKQAVKTYATSLKVDAPAYDLAQRHFWTSVEQDLASLFALAAHPDLATDIPASAWGKSVRSAAHSAFERSCASGNPRQIQAFALGLSKLTFEGKAPTPTQTTNA